MQPLRHGPPKHVVLLGDSIFDNAAFTRDQPDVVTHLRGMLPHGWKVTLCAIDGATTDQLSTQLARVPADATNLVVAIGGNDALQNIDLLNLRVASTAQALSIVADRLAEFERTYRMVIDDVLRLGRGVTVCTIYNGALDEETARLARVALMMFNDVILRTAFERSVDVIELRAICSDVADYANPIEPSGAGQKINAAIAPEAALRSTFGESVSGPVADIVVRNWGVLIALVGAMLIYGARNPAARPLALTVAGASKAIFIVLVLSHGGRFLGYQAGIAVVVDLLWVVVFALYFLAVRRTPSGHLKVRSSIGTA